MNFLAHAVLAGDDPGLVVGGVVGDWIKGPLPGTLPPDLARGVALHRAIDSFAETQADFCRSRNRISPARRRYAGILVDIFYDHLLAQAWAANSTTQLEAYTALVYAQIGKRLPDLPEAARPALRLMAVEDWLSSYREIESIATVLRRMSRRMRQPNPLSEGQSELGSEREGFNGDFQSWLVEAKAFAGTWRRAH